MLIMVMLFVLTVMVAGIYWHMFGKGIKRIIKRQIEFIKMKRDMKKLKSKWYYTGDIAYKDIMEFNKKYWGGLGFVRPTIWWNNYTNMYMIRF